MMSMVILTEKQHWAMKYYPELWKMAFSVSIIWIFDEAENP